MKKFITLTALNAFFSVSCLGAEDVPSRTPSPQHTTVSAPLSDFNFKRMETSALHEENKHYQIAINLPKDIFDRLNKKNDYEFANTDAVTPLLQFAINSDLTAEKVKPREGGFVSGKIYKVTATNSRTQHNEKFYIKYLRKKLVLVSSGRCVGELSNLKFLSENEIIQSIQNTIQIILPESMFQYRVNDEQKLFMILPAAPGESFTQIIKKKNHANINKAFATFGAKLAAVHLHHRHFDAPQTQAAYPPTKDHFINTKVIVHGDCHGNNIFYDSTTGKISFIDVETMVHSFDKDNKPAGLICYDLLYMILMSPKTFGNYMSKYKWEPFLHLLEAYVKTYPEEERTGICDYLVYCLQNKNIEFTDIFKHFKWKKGFSSQAMEGKTLLADYIKETFLVKLWTQQYVETSPRTSEATKVASEKFKMETEKTYASSQQSSPPTTRAFKEKMKPRSTSAPASPSAINSSEAQDLKAREYEASPSSSSPAPSPTSVAAPSAPPQTFTFSIRKNNPPPLPTQSPVATQTPAAILLPTPQAAPSGQSSDSPRTVASLKRQWENEIKKHRE